MNITFQPPDIVAVVLVIGMIVRFSKATHHIPRRHLINHCRSGIFVSAWPVFQDLVTLKPPPRQLGYPTLMSICCVPWCILFDISHHRERVRVHVRASLWWFWRGQRGGRSMLALIRSLDSRRFSTLSVNRSLFLDDARAQKLLFADSSLKGCNMEKRFSQANLC